MCGENGVRQRFLFFVKTAQNISHIRVLFPKNRLTFQILVLELER